ncbi:outer membrane beta-barrel protein [Flavobacterium sp.]|uniref:outer membrane beta-barrel protein n=1 Tax=Flavobacterium sp. TaxID=239 RepID=UPI0026096498|nr:outer membrane beta-barrel protein [Flavobacterium sp.]MDD3005290.1 TonB-dependent receptor [Flavobacterium sp.]
MLKKHFICLLFLSFSSLIFAQNTITIKGKVIENTSKLPLESATVYLTTVKDSTIIDYTITDKNGNFSIPTKKNSQPALLKVSFITFKEYVQQLDNLSASKDLGVISILEEANDLNEVVIKSQAPPIRIKQDTLEFNASSFKVREDSNVEALLKQLPGVEISTDGKITVNGKEVNNILVNGKPFFGKDGKVATKNLPAEIIDKVQVTDTKTKEEELTGQAASSDEKTINLTIQEDKNKGLFGKFTAGAGTDDRYESSGLINYFKDEFKISFLGASNNINSVGFSMDEIFDSMGGGRNMYSSSDGSFNIDGQQFGGGNGITTSNMIGLNYSDKIGKKLDPSASYFYNSSESENDSRSRVENLLPEDKFTTASAGSTRNINNGHNVSLELSYKIDSLTTLNIRPNLKKSNSRFTSRATQNSVNEFGAALNESNSYNNNTSNRVAFENDLYLVKRFKKKGRSISVNFNNENTNNQTEGQDLSTTLLYKDAAIQTINRNLMENNDNKYNKYSTSISYTEPLLDSLSVTIGTRYTWNNSKDDKGTFNYDPTTDRYSIKNDSLSNYITSKTDVMNPFVSFNLRKKNLSGRFSLGTEVTRFNNFSNYLNEKTILNKDYVFPTMNGYINYRLTKSKSVYANYRYSVSIPTANQMLPVINISNPLNTIIGNPDLEPVKRHNFYFGYNNYDYATRSGLYIYSGGSLNENQIVSSTVYDSSAKRTTTFENTGTTYSSYLGGSWQKSYKKEQHTFKIGFGLDGDLSLSKGLTNNQSYEAKGFSLNPNAEFSWEYGEILTVSPSYSYNYSETEFKNYSIDGSSNYKHIVKLETTSYWPKHFVLGNDFGYTYNSNIADGFQKDFYLWNVSLGYNFLGDKLLAKVKVYDLLNQNVNATRTITPTAIQDIENTVLRRYAMFSLTYKIEKFGGKKESSRRWGH